MWLFSGVTEDIDSILCHCAPQFSYSLSGANIKSLRDKIIGGCAVWPSRLDNNDVAVSCQHVHVYKHCHCVALQFASASLNDRLMSAAGVHPSALKQMESTCHGHWTAVEYI